MTTNLSRRDRMIAAVGGVVALYALAGGIWFMSQEQAWKVAAKKYGTAAKKTLSPMIRGRRLKIYYALQVSTNPQTLRLFVNDPKLVTPAYQSYIEKAIRAKFGLEGAPLRMFIKARPRSVQPKGLPGSDAK